MKFYIAGRGDAEGIARMRALRDKLVALGHVQTYDWSADIERNEAAGKRDEDLTLADKIRYAEADLKGVRDAFVVCYQEPPRTNKSEGAACEAMHAIDHDVKLVAVAPEGVPRCLMLASAEVIVTNDDDAFKVLVALASEADPPCTCTTLNSAFEENPEGHDVACPRWGTRLPNTSLSTIG